MAKKPQSIDPRNLPWSTPDGYLDPAKVPIDHVLKRALSRFPPEIAISRFEGLSDDEHFSIKRREKFADVSKRLQWRSLEY